jgi:cyclophilin family peptidyl-prolyl cis-trans isomerase/HEAT repeat protein
VIGRRGSAALCVLIVLGACGRAPESIPLPGPGPEPATATLDSAAIDVLGRALRLEDARRFDDSTFRALAGGAPAEVRRRVLLAAGRVGDTAAAPLLLEHLRGDPEPGVRADAAFALGILGDTSDAVVRGLLDARPSGWIPVRDSETVVAEEILAALGAIGSDPARRSVIDALREVYPASNPRLARVAGAALLAVWRFPPSSAGRLVVERYLDSPDPGLRWRAAYALGRGGGPEALPLLLPYAGDPDEHRVRAYVVRALAAPRADSAGVRDTAIALLADATTDPHPHVRINAVRALGSFGADAPLDTLVARLADPVANVAMAAVAALAAVGGAGADVVGPLGAVVDDPERPLSLRGAALEAVAALDPAAARTPLQAWVTGGVQERYLAARALAALPPETAAPLRSALASDRDRRVALAALNAGESTPADSAARRALLAPTLPPVPPPSDAAFYRDLAARYVAGTLAGHRRPRVRITTARAEIVLELMPDHAPLTVYNFLRLARSGFFDLGVWHRVVPNFVLQDGAPGGDPDGGPGWTLRDELNRVRYDRGILGMAHAGPDTGGSQWFITHSPQPHLNGSYTAFGRVIEGMEAADAVLQGELIGSISVEW